jgi:hypothetical protein
MLTNNVDGKFGTTVEQYSSPLMLSIADLLNNNYWIRIMPKQTYGKRSYKYRWPRFFEEINKDVPVTDHYTNFLLAQKLGH